MTLPQYMLHSARGDEAFRDERFRLAAEEYSLALELARSLGGEPLACALENLGKIRLKEQNPAQAARLYQEALTLRVSLKSAHDLSLLEAINGLADSCCHQKELRAALSWQIRALEIASQQGLKNRARVRQLCRLAFFYGYWDSGSGDPLPLYEEAINILNELGCQDELLEQAEGFYILCLMARADFDIAEKFCRQKLENLRVSGLAGIEEVPILLSLAEIEERKKGHPEALYEQILLLAKQGTALEEANILIKLDRLLASQGRDLSKYARPCLEQALTLIESTLGANHPELIEVLDRLGWRYYMSDRKRAISYQQRRVAIIKEHWAESQPEYAAALSTLGDFLAAESRFEESLQIQLQALALTEAAFGNAHFNTIMNLARVADDYCWLGRAADALPYLLRADQGIKSLLEQNSRQTAISFKLFSIYSALADCYKDSDPAKASEYLEKLQAVSIMKVDWEKLAAAYGIAGD